MGDEKDANASFFYGAYLCLYSRIKIAHSIIRHKNVINS